MEPLQWCNWNGNLKKLRGTVRRPRLGSRDVSMQALKGLFMEKWLCWASMGVAGLLLLLFLLDLIVKVPFGGISAFVDILSILASGLVLYLAWDAFKDLR